MRMLASNILFHELIGLRATIIESTDETLKDLSGEIIDETKQTIRIRSEQGLKIIPKGNVTFRVVMPDGQSVIVSGKKIMYRPEDRIRRMTYKR